MSTRARPTGFSILEVLVALAIGAILLLGLTDVLVSSKVSYIAEENRARIQEIGRFAMGTIARDVRATRSLDCPRIDPADDIAVTVKACALLDLPTGSTCATASAQERETAHLLQRDRAIGYDAPTTAATGNAAAWLTDLPAGASDSIGARWLRGDVLATWHLDGEGTHVTSAVTALAPGSITVANGNDLEKGTIAAITDCETTDVFAITNRSESETSTAIPHGTSMTSSSGDSETTTIVNATDTLAHAYNSGLKRFRARVYPLTYRVYYICCVNARTGALQNGATNVARCNNDPIVHRPALCRWDIADTNKNQVLANDVADLRLTFSGNTPTQFADPTAAARPAFHANDTSPVPTAAWVTLNNRWEDVSGVSVELLIAGPDANTRQSTNALPPASVQWPPNAATDTTIDADTLGASLSNDRRLYERFSTTLAIRTGTPWYLTP